jgi:hypothetical protein
MARRFLGMINARWKPLDNLVAAYNAEVQRYNKHVDPDGAVRLRPLSHRDLREVGIDDADGEIWDVERLLCNADWAVHDFVRRGIDARFRLLRVAEERKFLLLHVERILKWLSQDAGVLFRALRLPKTQSVKKLVQILLLHRAKVALSFLRAAKKRKNAFFWTPEQQQELQELHEAIVEVLGVPLEEFQHDMEQADGEEGVELPADNDDNASDHGGLDEEVVDRLMQEFEREVELERVQKGDQEAEWVDEEPDVDRDLALLRMGIPLH